MGSPWRLTALIGCAEIGPGFVQIQAAGSGGLIAGTHQGLLSGCPIQRYSVVVHGAFSRVQGPKPINGVEGQAAAFP